MSFKWAEITTFLLLCYASNRYFFGSGQDGTGGWCSLVHKSKCCEPVIGCVGKLTWGRLTCKVFLCSTAVWTHPWELRVQGAHFQNRYGAKSSGRNRSCERKSAPNLFYVNRNRANQLKLRRSDWISGVSRTTSGSPDFLSSTVVVIKAAMTIFCPKHSWPKNEIFWTKRWSRSCCFVKIPKLADEIMVQAFALRIFDKQPYQNHGDFCIRKKYVSPFCYAMIRDFFVSCHDGTPWTHASHWRGHFVAVHHVGGWGL